MNTITSKDDSAIVQNSLGTWFGEPIENLDRAGLLDVISHLSRMLKQEREMIEVCGEAFVELYTNKKLGIK